MNCWSPLTGVQSAGKNFNSLLQRVTSQTTLQEKGFYLAQALAFDKSAFLQEKVSAKLLLGLFGEMDHCLLYTSPSPRD